MLFLDVDKVLGNAKELNAITTGLNVSPYLSSISHRAPFHFVRSLLDLSRCPL